MSEVRLAASIEGRDGAPVVILGNPIGTTRAIWGAQALLGVAASDVSRLALRPHD
jgi:hypothetical protein